MKPIRGFILAVGLMSLAQLVSPTVVLADQAALNITTSGPADLVAKPGQTVSTVIKVKNNNPTTEQLKITLKKFYVPENDVNPTIGERAAGDDYFDWVTFSKTQFAAEPNVWNDITMTINVPKSAAFGYYYAVMISRSQDQGPIAGKQVINSQVANFVLLNVDVPGAKRELEVTEFSTSQRVYEYLPAKFTVKIKNTGNVHVAPIGNIFIGTGKGASLGTIDINATKGYILPHSSRIFTASWADGFPKYEVSQTNKGDVAHLKWDFTQVPKFRIGKYTANLRMVYDDGTRDQEIAGTVSFWVIPWRLIGILLLIFVFVPIGMYVTIRRVISGLRHGKA